MHKTNSNRILFDRYAAILAILAAASYDYGMRIWLLAGIAASVSILSEYCSLRIQKKPISVANLDAGVIGLILLLMLPATVPVSLLIMSCIFTIIIGRAMFGGKENPVIPPAALGYCFCLLNSRSEVTLFPVSKETLPLFRTDGTILEEGVSILWNRSGKFSVSVLEWLTGLPKQPIGTGSIVLLLAVLIVLSARRAASGWVIVPAVAALIVGNLALSSLQHCAADVIGSCLTNQALFAIIFLHADSDYAPPTLAGIAYGFAVGFASFFATRILYIYDAPILLAVLLSPLRIWLSRMMLFYDDVPDAAQERRAAV